MLTETPDGLYCEAGGFHIDPWGAVPRALITHAHGDHARAGSAAYLCADACAPLLARRFGPDATIESQPYDRVLTLGQTRVSFHPAGHVLGSAQIRVEGPGGVWVVSGDYKRAADPTCAPFEVVPCDVFVTESTFALPIYRWDPAADVIADLLAWWNASAAMGLTAIVFCYTIGKAQRLLAELARVTDRRVWVHGMLLPMIEAYREAGVAMPPTRALIERPRGTSFAGELVLAPPSARGTPWMRRLGDLSDALASGLMRVRGVRRQRAYDRGFVLSDHADWPALNTAVDASEADEVWVTHGYREEFVRWLNETRPGRRAIGLSTRFEGEHGAADAAVAPGAEAGNGPP